MGARPKTSPDQGSRRVGRRFEPWPWALGLALAAMIVVSLAFFAAARSHPDPVVRGHPAAEDGARPAR